jgi:hypothetical protein
VTAELRGRRVELIRCFDPYTRLRPGALGTVSLVDDAGTVFVDWDGGSSLGLVPNEDEYRLLPEFGSHCAACGAPLSERDERAEVINRTTGARGVTHAECYLADRDCYALA